MLKKFKFLCTITIILGIIIPFAYAGSCSYNCSNINGSNINCITLNMKDSTLKSAILNAKNEITSTEPLEKMAKNIDAIAAINGTYFEAYSGNPIPWGTIIKDKKVLHVGNTGSVVGITEDNKLIIDNVNISLKGYVNGELRAYPWRVNHPSTEPEAITIFTPEYGQQVHIENGAKAVIVTDGIITSIVDTSFTCPENGFVISYNKGIAYLVSGRYKIGDKVEYEHEFKTNYTKPEEWSKVVNAIGAGPSLIINGIVTADGEKEGFWEAKINTNKAARTFIGNTEDGKVLIGTIPSATLKEAAAICQSLNLINAMCLDGGGSVALYYRDKGSITQGRNVNNGIAFIKEKPKPIELSVNIDGEKVNVDNNTGKPYIDENGRTQVPIRVVMETIGADVGWNDHTKTAIIKKDGITIEITIGENYIKVNGNEVKNDTVAVINNNRTYLPIRIVLESLGYSVDWDNSLKAVNINSA